jgi:hypothetical protein
MSVISSIHDNEAHIDPPILCDSSVKNNSIERLKTRLQHIISYAQGQNIAYLRHALAEHDTIMTQKSSAVTQLDNKMRKGSWTNHWSSLYYKPRIKNLDHNESQNTSYHSFRLLHNDHENSFYGYRWDSIERINLFVRRSILKFLTESILYAIPSSLSHFPTEKTIACNIKKLFHILNIHHQYLYSSIYANNYEIMTAMMTSLGDGINHNGYGNNQLYSNHIIPELEDIFCMELIDSPSFIDLIARHGHVLDAHAF